MLIGESNVAIDPAIGGYGAADIYLGEFSPHHMDSAEFSKWSRRMAFELGVFCRQERNAPDLRTLQCSTDLEKAFNNHRIPNPLHGESLTPNSLTPLQRVGIPPHPTYFLRLH